MKIHTKPVKYLNDEENISDKPEYYKKKQSHNWKTQNNSIIILKNQNNTSKIFEKALHTHEDETSSAVPPNSDWARRDGRRTPASAA